MRALSLWPAAAAPAAAAGFLPAAEFPRAYWSLGRTWSPMSLRAVGVSVAGGVSALNVEDSSIANKLITTWNVVNSCGLTSPAGQIRSERSRIFSGCRSAFEIGYPCSKTYPVWESLAMMIAMSTYDKACIGNRRRSG